MTQRTAIFILVLGALFVLRLLLVSPLDLASDEAYYWLWSHDLRLSYLDHPPLTAWLLALGDLWPGSAQGTPLRVRVVALLCGLVTVGCLYGLARTAIPRAEGIVVALALTPALALGGAIMTPDAPLLVCWTAGVWLVLRCAGVLSSSHSESEQMPWAELVLLVVVVALGLSAKLPMVLFVVSACVGVLFCAPVVASRRFAIVAALLGGVILAAPLYVVGFSEGHMVGFQAGHVASRVAVDFVRPWELLAGTLGLLTPVLGVAFLGFAVVGWRASDRATRLLWSFTAVPLFTVWVASWIVKVELNWLSVAWPAAIPAVVRWSSATSRRLAWFWGSIAAFGVTALLVVTVPGWMHAGDASAPNPLLGRVWGWEAWCVTVVSETQQPALVVTPRYQEAAQIAFWTGAPTTTWRALHNRLGDKGPVVEDPERRPSAFEAMPLRVDTRLVVLLETKMVMEPGPFWHIVERRSVQGSPDGGEGFEVVVLERRSP